MHSSLFARERAERQRIEEEGEEEEEEEWRFDRDIPNRVSLLPVDRRINLPRSLW